MLGCGEGSLGRKWRFARLTDKQLIKTLTWQESSPPRLRSPIAAEPSRAYPVLPAPSFAGPQQRLPERADPNRGVESTRLKRGSRRRQAIPYLARGR
jgi:hypothetical protein